MFYYLKGTCTFIDAANIVLDVNQIGYEILVSKPKCFHVGEDYTIYAYMVVKEDQQYLIGFASLEERRLFLTLIEVKGIGPKTAMNILGSCTPEMLLNSIENENIAYLKKLPGVGGKAAAQIVLDLKGKLKKVIDDNPSIDEARLALRKLGYKAKTCDLVLQDIDPQLTSEEILGIALKKLRKK